MDGHDLTLACQRQKESKVNGSTRRILILVSKVLQNISNGISEEVSSNKEAYMGHLSSFVDKSNKRINHFFQQLAEVPFSLS